MTEDRWEQLMWQARRVAKLSGTRTCVVAVRKHAGGWRWVVRLQAHRPTVRS